MAKRRILEDRSLLSTCAKCGLNMRYRRIEIKVGKKKERVSFTYCEECNPVSDEEERQGQ